MRSRNFPIGLAAVIIVAVTVFGAAPHAPAQTLTVLHDFVQNASDGDGLYSNLIRDSSGNFYGTTAYGGTYSNGTVFELSPQTGGGWGEHLLYSFGSTSSDGIRPYGGLVFDAAGNLYGTTLYGGPSNQGTVFELSPTTGGGWTEQILHSFTCGTTDGCKPYAGFIRDATGKLYGTTFEGGANNSNGTVFELAQTTGGKWQERIIHSFGSYNGDGEGPYAGLLLDAHGNLYGTTVYGGANSEPPCIAGSCGAVFEMKPTAGGGWTEKVLYSFSKNGTDGFYPMSGVVMDAAGNLYGTTNQGGSGCGQSCGVVFKLKPGPSGNWQETLLHTFTGSTSDGNWPVGGLTIGSGGKLYGTTTAGGGSLLGTIFELTAAGGTWQETVLHSFDGTDGYTPSASMILNSAGNLYGTALFGGTYSAGTVFELTP
jgi:uncharacterized repeat protein (TIGR03803 family)